MQRIIEVKARSGHQSRRRSHREPHYDLRVFASFLERLHRLPRLERRLIARKFRAALEATLTEWERTHDRPARNQLSFALNPRAKNGK